MNQQTNKLWGPLLDYRIPCKSYTRWKNPSLFKANIPCHFPSHIVPHYEPNSRVVPNSVLSQDHGEHLPLCLLFPFPEIPLPHVTWLIIQMYNYLLILSCCVLQNTFILNHCSHLGKFLELEMANKGVHLF